MVEFADGAVTRAAGHAGYEAADPVCPVFLSGTGDSWLESASDPAKLGQITFEAPDTGEFPRTCAGLTQAGADRRHDANGIQCRKRMGGCPFPGS